MAILEEVKLDYSVTGVNELSAARKELEATAKASGSIETNIKGASDQVDKSGKAITTSAGGMKGAISAIGPAIIATFSVGALISFQKQIIEITAKFQKYEAVLTNTLGSNSAAKKALQDIQDFAAKTPFSVDELTASFVKLANQGFTPNTLQSRQLGDLAASTGKSFDQLTEAILDAQSGQFERLKEFGIKASKSGDDVSFTFKGVSTTVKNTSKDIQQYLLGLGDLKGVTGSMAAISGTLEGQISNLGDTFDSLLLSIGKNEAEGISGAISGLSTIIGELGKLVRGESSALDGLAAAANALFTPLSKVINLFSFGTNSAEALNGSLKALNFIFIALEKAIRFAFLPLTSMIDGFTILKDVVTGAGFDKLNEDLIALGHTLSLNVFKSEKDGLDRALNKVKLNIEANKAIVKDEQKTQDELTAKQKKELEKRNKQAAAAEQKRLNDYFKAREEASKRREEQIKRADKDLETYEEKRAKREHDQRGKMLKQAGLQIAQSDQLTADRKKALQQKQLADFIKTTNTQIQVTQAATNIIGSLIQITGDRSGKLAAFQKGVATLEIGISTAKAIAEGIASAQSVPFPGNLVAIGTTIATVLGNVAQAKQIIQGSGAVPKFKLAKGVIDLQGEGTGTSDSIPAMLSRGESVMTAEETKRFRPTLEAIRRKDINPDLLNRSAQGNIDYDRLANAIIRGNKSLPLNSFAFDEKGFSHFIQEGNSRKQIIARRYKGGI